MCCGHDRSVGYTGQTKGKKKHLFFLLFLDVLFIYGGIIFYFCLCAISIYFFFVLFVLRVCRNLSLVSSSGSNTANSKLWSYQEGYKEKRWTRRDTLFLEVVALVKSVYYTAPSHTHRHISAAIIAPGAAQSLPEMAVCVQNYVLQDDTCGCIYKIQPIGVMKNGTPKPTPNQKPNPRHCPPTCTPPQKIPAKERKNEVKKIKKKQRLKKKVEPGQKSKLNPGQRRCSRRHGPGRGPRPRRQRRHPDAS